MTQNQNSKLARVLVPFPITLLVAFGYYLLKKTGFSSPYVSYRWLFLGQNLDSITRVCLFGPALVQKVDQYLEGISDNKALRRMFNFCCQGQTSQQKQSFYNLQRGIALLAGDPHDILEVCSDYFQNIIGQELNPFKDELPAFPASPNSTIVQQPGLDGAVILLDCPQFSQELDSRGRARKIGSTEIRLLERRAWYLEGQHLVVGVFGPAGVGKSSVTASLFFEMDGLVRSLNSRLGYEGADLNVGALDLDLATPTLRAILEGWGQERRLLQKSEWTPQMVVEGLERLKKTRIKFNILFVDLPGKITEITETLGASLDGSILVVPSGEKEDRESWHKYLRENFGLKQTREDSDGRRWRNFLRTNLGLEPFSLIFSTPRGNDEESLSLGRGQRQARGQIVGLDRSVKLFDPHISNLAKLLLFNFLPDTIERRERIREKYLL